MGKNDEVFSKNDLRRQLHTRGLCDTWSSAD